MGLFDDLLKKPTPAPQSDTFTASGSSTNGTQGGGNPPVDPLTTMTQPDIRIEKSEEGSIATESAINTAAGAPMPVRAIEVDDVSSILVVPTDSSGTQVQSQDPVYVAQSEVGYVAPLNTADIQPVQPTDVNYLGNLFGDSEPQIEKPISVELGVDVAHIGESIAVSDVQNSSLYPIDSTQSVTLTSDPEEPIHAELGSLVSDPIGDSHDTDTLFGFDSTEQVAELETGTTYQHPIEFITDSIERIDVMMSCIDAAHSAELEQALKNKTEKEKYAAFEEQNYQNAEKYVTEKNHALSMRNYFIEQGRAAGVKIEENASELVASVETILTGLSVQNVVSETVKHEKKAKSNKQEKEVGLLGL